MSFGEKGSEGNSIFCNIQLTPVTKLELKFHNERLEKRKKSENSNDLIKCQLSVLVNNILFRNFGAVINFNQHLHIKKNFMTKSKLNQYESKIRIGIWKC
ncbi:CLUMA_CG005787, isoform A [Clunio marinus]|uniref:CLUMA_CG005787, isoform A n=1 Tax=Clunio marinus TaxID=568069 RepID=A0A1J1HVU1_9DIPT|nr:CLUMA_CG005787, isoform A [Clunio marinus]